MSDGKSDDKARPEPVWLQLVKVFPSTALSLCAIYFFFQAAPIALDLLRRNAVSQVEVAGFKLAIVQQTLAELTLPKCNRNGDNKRVEPLTEAERDRVTQRFKQSAKALASTSILWVDSFPLGNACERRVLQAAGVIIESARSTAEAIDWLGIDHFDLVISDFLRAGDQVEKCFPDREKPANSGCRIAQLVAALDASKRPGLVIYAQRISPSLGTPPNIDRMVNRPIDLFYAVADFAERRASERP